MRKWGVIKTDRFHTILISMVLATTALPILEVPFAYAIPGGVANRYDKLSTPVVSAVATHEIGFAYTNMSVPIGSVSFEFCANDPLPNTPCTAPTGFDATGVTIASQTGEVGFGIDPTSTANKIILTRPASVPVAGASTYELANIINPSTTGTFYMRLQTFTSTDGTGADVEAGGIALSTSAQISVQSEVPPYLKFCASVTITAFDCSTANSFLIDLGEFLTTQTRAASAEFVVATNAGSGYSVTVSGGTLTSGNNIINPIMPGGPSVIGVSQFGMNLRANATPSMGSDPTGPGIGAVSANYNSPNVFRFQNGDIIATALGASDNQKFTVSYVANISQSQAPGYYATTLTYICLANF